MATKTVNLSGEVTFSQLFKPDKEYNKYTVSVKLTPASYETFKKAGLEIGKADENDGLHVATFRRDPESLDFNKNPIGPPIVVLADGTEVTNRMVGRGSRVTVSLQVYDLTKKKSKGHRLMTVVVHEMKDVKGPGAFKYYE